MLTTATPITEANSKTVFCARKAFWLFLGSFLSFIGVVIVSMVLSNSEYQSALYDKADELGVNQNFLPADELAELVRTYPDPLVTYLAVAALYLVGALLFAAGLRILGDVSGRSALTRAAGTLAVLGGVCMAVMTFLPRLLAEGSVWLTENWWLYMTLVGIAVIATCLALTLAAVAMHASGLARRTGIVVVVLCALTIVAQLTVSAPPIVPNLLAAVFAFNVKRSAQKNA